MFCVYLTVYFGQNKQIPRRYIGSTKIERITAGYKGSVKSRKYKDIFASIRNECKTRILSKRNTHEEAILEELRLHMKYNVVKSEIYFNLSYAAPNGYFGKPTKGEDHPFYGKQHKDSTKLKISENLKNQYKNGKVSPFAFFDVSGENNPFFGKKHTEETKNKMRKPKSYVPRYPCPHCNKIYDAGNLKQHMMRNGFSVEDVELIKMKPEGWTAPSHEGNHGNLPK